MRLTSHTIAAALPKASLDNGRAWHRDGCVSALEVEPNGRRVTALVRREKDQRPYRVYVRVGLLTGEAVSIDGECNCAVGYNCEHVAAALLAAFDEKTRGMPAANDTRDGQSSPAPPAEHEDYPPDVTHRLLYLLDLDENSHPPRVKVHTVSAKRLTGGGYGAASGYSPGNVYAGHLPRFVRPTDESILRRLARHRGSSGIGDSSKPTLDAAVLAEVVSTGRCHWQSKDTPPLRLGEIYAAECRWLMDEQGNQHPSWHVSPMATHVLALVPPWYVDLDAGCIGPLHTGLPDTALAALSETPTVAPNQVPLARKRLKAASGGVPMPLPEVLPVDTIAGVAPHPRLRLYSVRRPGQPDASSYIHGAELSFGYRGARVPAGDEGEMLTRFADGRVVEIRRDLAAEQAALEHLHRLGLRALGGIHAGLPSGADSSDLGFRSTESEWPAFVEREVPQLRSIGWRVDLDRGFRFNIVRIDAWSVQLDARDNGDWFDLSVGVDVEGERVNLLPLLVDMLRTLPVGATRETLDRRLDGADVSVRLTDGRLLRLPTDRVRNILATLIELYDDAPLDEAGRLGMARATAGRLSELDRALGGAAHWAGGEALRALAERLDAFTGVQRVPAPEALQTTLRGYQRAGLDWLQFLREYALAGILADDMGLGKTVQTLAHLLVEKASGRADGPSLVVAPTSLLGNWRREASRFAPRLAVLTLHGPTRRRKFRRIPTQDLVITNYPLLARDSDALLEQDWHLLILDEAQQIKNHRTQASAIVRRLRARHRLCLTGTPLENHLGELWSLFDFLLPGLLGDEDRFRRLFRTPIEREADEGRQAALARRVAPFVLRRTKTAVAAELPPKTVMVRSVVLEDEQRDLYESIRLAMHARIRQEVEERGLARSQIVILDALLKLRQVCCDPRLVKVEAARRVNRSAKLEMLMEMLPEMVEEGRRVLVFSQFTTMLALIEEALTEAGVSFLTLTGQTRERTAIVERFQAGEVPVFLLSLKAGGVGLNLTAADTVVHYDPWWNPAVEQQATDRAHRIGQDKPVFVYKLLTEGTVEEKIQALQARKQALADGVYGAPAKAAAQWTREDLEVLFEPLGE